MSVEEVREIVKRLAQQYQTYSVRFYCGNCHHHFLKHIEKGKESPSKTKCTNCECLTAEKR